MVNKCCVPYCKSNYVSKKEENEKVSVYKFPNDEKDRNLWISAIPRQNLIVTKHTVVCRLHWPETEEFISLRGRNSRPKNPPSIFPNIPTSCLRSLPPKERPTTKSLREQRVTSKDELAEFKEKDLLIFSSLLSEIPKRLQNIVA